MDIYEAYGKGHTGYDYYKINNKNIRINSIKHTHNCRATVANPCILPH